MGHVEWERLQKVGFDGIGGSVVLPNIADHLEAIAIQTGDARYVFLSEAVSTLQAVYDVYGAVRAKALQRLDEIFFESLPTMLGQDQLKAVRAAVEFRDRAHELAKSLAPTG